MPEGAHPSVPQYRVRTKYTISQKSDVIRAYREVVVKLSECHGPLSPQAISDIIEDAFYSFSRWTEIKDPLFVSTFERSLDPHTLRNFLSCELGPNLRKTHARSIRVLHAFLQIIAHEPPTYLRDCLGTYFPEIVR